MTIRTIILQSHCLMLGTRQSWSPTKTLEVLPNFSPKSSSVRVVWMLQRHTPKYNSPVKNTRQNTKLYSIFGRDKLDHFWLPGGSGKYNSFGSKILSYAQYIRTYGRKTTKSLLPPNRTFLLEYNNRGNNQAHGRRMDYFSNAFCHICRDIDEEDSETLRVKRA